MFRKNLLLCLLILLVNITGHCSNYHDFQSWGSVTSIGNICRNDNPDSCMKLWLEGQLRSGDNSTRISQSMFRTALGYDVTKHTSLWLG
jgi:hypothetical protein